MAERIRNEMPSAYAMGYTHTVTVTLTEEQMHLISAACEDAANAYQGAAMSFELRYLARTFHPDNVDGKNGLYTDSENKLSL